MYAKFVKRWLDLCISFLALIVLSPLFLVLIVVGAVAMKGNPFFVQRRPGRIDKKTGKETIFPLIKFRTMSNEKDCDGNLLPDVDRLNWYGKLLRASSLDELPELVNIFLGQLSCVGPRPLAVKYLPFYNEEERKRHTVTPGLTGLAQVNGRNSTTWEERFRWDIDYVDHLSFWMDVQIIVKTVLVVLKRNDIGTRGIDSPEDFDVYRMRQLESFSKTETGRVGV